MPTIEMSSAFFNTASTGFLPRLMNQADVYFSTGGMIPAAQTYSTHLFKIMKGTMPSDFSTLTSGTASRSSDVLLTYSRSSAVNTFILDLTVNPIVCNTSFVNAIASGTATWFWNLAYNPQDSSNSIFVQFIGTVGLTGSGADLEMSDTNIISGSPYKVNNLKILFPTTWTY